MNKKNSNQPFFIVGAGRSGSTMLRLMINQHPRLRVPGESWFISDLMERLPLNSLLTQEQKQIAFNLISNHSRWKQWEIADEKLREAIFTLEQPRLCDLIDAVFRKCNNPENKPRWGDKTPCYVQHIDRLLEVFPHAKFIHLIRDGRDVCLSGLKTKWHGITIEDQARHWCEMVNTGIKSGRNLGEHKYIEVNYQDLVLSSETTLKQICQFLGEEYDSKMLDYYKSADQELTDFQKEKGFHDNTKLPPQTSKVDKWRREMSPMAVACFEAIAGETMDIVGQTRLFRGPLQLITWGYYLGIKTRTVRKRWGWQIPYGILRKMGLPPM